MADFQTFPSNKTEALTMLYLQNQDLSTLSPEELLVKYYDTYDRIRAHGKAVTVVRRQSRSTT